MAGQQTTNILAALLVCRVPGWYVVDLVGHLTSPPIAGTDTGFELLNAARSRIFASSKLVQDRRTGFIALGPGGADVTATYSISIDATGPSIFDALAGGAASASDILDGIHDAIVATAPPGITIEKILDGEERTIALRYFSTGSGDSSAPSTFVVTSFSSTGAGDMQVFAEPTSFALEIWATARRGRNDGPPAADHWVCLAGWDVIDRVGIFGYAEALPGLAGRREQLLNTAGAERIIASIPSFVLPGGDAALTQPAFYVHIGPATDEEIDFGDS